MAIVKCENGHYYNNEEFANCPYCTGKSDISATVPLRGEPAPPVPQSYGNTEPLYEINKTAGYIPETRPLTVVDDYGHTQFKDDTKNSDIKPVRGWLVICKGEKIGQDFRIHTGMNTIGRKPENDIVFDFDNTISGIKACYVIYDERNNAFHLTAGESKNLIYINGAPLLQPTQLKDNDIIEIGVTKVVFRSLCNETFNYNIGGDESAQ